MTQKILKIVAILIVALFTFSHATSIIATPEAPWNDEHEWNNWYPNIQLPDEEQLFMYVTYGIDSYFDIQIDGVFGPSDVANGTYLGWCFQKNIQMTRDQWHNITMYHSYDPNKPYKYKNANWDIINYIINNKNGASREDIQEAIWYFMEGYTPTSTSTDVIIQDAKLYGNNFLPQPGQRIAIIVNLTSNGIEPPVQRAFIEVALNHYEGKDPNYWIDNPDNWDYDCGSCAECVLYTDPTTQVHEIFSVFSAGTSLGDRTIYETLQRCTYLPREMVLREAISGLLNSCHPNITYPLTCDQIVDAINFEFGNDPQSVWWGYSMLRLFGILYFYNRLDTNP